MFAENALNLNKQKGVATLRLNSELVTLMSNLINRAMFYMVQNPEILKKVQAELDANPNTKMKDRSCTPYTEATLHEIQRKANILPMSVFHYTSEPIRCGKEYIIPANTFLVPLIGKIMRDPEHFGPDPEKFDPERYLSTVNGKLTFTPHPRVIPFGIGKRRCLGEVMARTSLFKFFTAIVQKFDVVSGQKEPLLDEADDGFTKAPLPYKLIFNLRK